MENYRTKLITGKEIGDGIAKAIFENVAKVIDNDLKELIPDDIEFDREYRRAFIELMLEDLGFDLTKRKFIYIEDDYFDELSYLLQGNPNNMDNIYSFTYNQFKETLQENIASSNGVTIIDIEGLVQNYKYVKLPLPSYFKKSPEEYPIIIGINAKRFSKEGVMSAALWTITHEVMHNFHNESDEQLTQRNTFDFLFKYGYTKAISVVFVYNVLRNFGMLKFGQFMSAYDVSNYIFNQLKEKDPNLLISLILYIETFLDGSYESLSEKQIDRLTKWVKESLEEVEAETDSFDNYEDSIYY